MPLAKSVSRARLGDVDILEINNPFAKAQISLFGGHILSFKPSSDNRERLWLSDNVILDSVKPLRGGVPVCWPWFSDSHNQPDKDLPSHGWVRNQQWDLLDTEDSEQGTRLVLSPKTFNGPGFKGEALLKLVVFVGQKMSIELITENIGKDSFSYTCALHTYFAVDAISSTKLLGLSGLYKDKTRDWQSFETPEKYMFNEETDRVHLSTPESLSIKLDENITTEVLSYGHDSVVVWNPWKENAEKMKDMTDDGYKSMLCVETSVTQGQQVLPGEQHAICQIIG
jgi:glucose-6-phosphate 1-epimerase